MGYSQAFIDKHRDFNVGHDWWDSTYDDFEYICEILGIELDKNEPSFSGFWSQGDGASWAGTYRATQLTPWGTPDVATYDIAPAKIREHAPKDEELHSIADELCMLARIYHPVRATVGRYNSHYVHSMTMNVSEWEYWDDDIGFEGVDDAIAELIEETLLTQFRALADWLYTALEEEHEYLTSDEAVIESLKANEIEEDEEA
jgi:hypothetical protein